MSYASDQKAPREVEMQRKIQKIEDPTQKYMEYLRLTQQRPRISDVGFTIPRGRCH